MKERRPELIEQICIEQRTPLLTLADRFKDAGYLLYLTGGAVRDMMMNRIPVDYDLTTDAHPDQVMKLFKRTVPTGIKHGTVSVFVNNICFEVTTFRADSDYSDARHPDKVRFSNSLSEDLCRRDFTVNALAYDPLTKVLIDEHGGIEDIRTGTIRTIGRPEDRFYEDGLRSIRACRFAAQLEFSIEENTYHALCKNEIHVRTKAVAAERFTEELWKGLKVKSSSRMIHHLETSGLLFLFLFTNINIKLSTNEHALALIDMFDTPHAEFRFAFWMEQLTLRYNSAQHKSGNTSDDKTEQLMNQIANLKLSNHKRKLIKMNFIFIESIKQNLAEVHPDSSADILNEEFLDFMQGNINQHIKDNFSPLHVRRILARLSQTRAASRLEWWEILPEIFKTSDAGLLFASQMSHPLTVNELDITGTDMIALGQEGKVVGKTLSLLLRMVVEDPSLNRHDRLLRIAKSNLPEQPHS